MTGRCHQPLQAEPHRALGEIADRDHTAPGPVAGGERLGHGLEPSPALVGPGHRELHAEPFASRRPLQRPVGRQDRKAGDILGRGFAAAEEAIVGAVRRDYPAFMIHRDHRITQAGQDRSQAIAFLLAAQLLQRERGGLDTQLVGTRGEVLVGDPQLLDTRGQLLVERLQFLVGGLEFLVHRFDFLARGLRVLAGQEHRFVGHAELGDQRGQLLVRAQEPRVGRDRLVETLPGPSVGATLLLEFRNFGQLDDRALDCPRLDPVRPDLGFDETRRLADGVGGFHLEDGRGRAAQQGRIDGRANGAGRENLGQMDEVLVECRPVDSEHLPGRGVDAKDVVAGIDDDDANRQAQEQAVGQSR